MNLLSFFMNSDYSTSPLSNLHKLFTSVKVPFSLLPKRGLRSIISLVFHLKEDKELLLISKVNDPTQVTSETERATQADAGSPALVITASGHTQMVP